MNQKLDIAIASSRWQKVWQNQQWSWNDLAKKISHTHKTSETYATYMSSPKPRQAEIKDVGGFVGGYLTEGVRQKGHVKHRQILTLDIDNGYPDLWEDFQMYYPNTVALVYSTHAHSVVTPRLRLVLPLSRPVSPEEYEAIARKVASHIGMNHMDKTTFQADRLMYWPSTSKDGQYYFKQQDGNWLDADHILSLYRNWKDVSEWPLCPTENEIIKTDLKRQQDPTEKESYVGAFCRAYTITDAIEEFIPETYISCGNDRFTYTGGTTAAGAVVYEDKWLFSHHSTDPACGILCNAFDLVRIHKYGAMDTDLTLAMSKRPSFIAMSTLARTNAEVLKEMAIFGKDIDPETADWMGGLERTKNGDCKPTVPNFELILRNDLELKGKFVYNEFDHKIYDEGKKHITDVDEAKLRSHIEKVYGMYNAVKLKDAFDIISHENSFHPVREYLNGLYWDGEKRVDTLFIDLLGVPDTPYTRAVTRKCLTACVARVMQPGVKFDYMVVFIGAQGKGKSSLLFDLGGEWFSDTLDSVTGKDAYMQLHGVWLLEMGELSAVKKAEVEAVKNFITKRSDKFRLPFGKNTMTFQRQTVPFGSTNDYSFLKDPTGNRRFWPLIVTKKYQPGSIEPDPIWAEAVHYYRQGETLYLTDELEALAAAQQSEHTETDDRAGLIEAFVKMMLPPDWENKNTYERNAYINDYAYDIDVTDDFVTRDRVCAAEIWCELFKNKQSEMTSYNTKYIHNTLMNMKGWKRYGLLSYRKYGNQRSYVRIGGRYDIEDADIIIEQEKI